MSTSKDAEMVARSLLADPLPRRWAHTRGVARTAAVIARVIGPDANQLVTAAWLHDIGYAPVLAGSGSGFHPLDGARYLRDTGKADELICRLVAHHSCAMSGAAEVGLADDLITEFALPPSLLADALTYCDMTTGPDGQAMTVAVRLTEIISRYGSDHPVGRAIAASAPDIIAAVSRIAAQLASKAT